MKTFAFVLLLIGAAVAQEDRPAVKTSEVVLSDDGEKNAEQVQASLECVKDSKWNDFFTTNLPDLGFQFVRDHLSKPISQNKKYYIQINERHNVMYFKEGNNYFVNLNEIGDDGSDVLIMRSFLQGDFQNCVQLLPESCSWKGQRTVKYVEVCEHGFELAQGFKQDFFNIVIDDTEGEMNPIDVADALRDCYQPNVYSVAYQCYKNNLYFDPTKAVEYLKSVQAKLELYGFKTTLNMKTMTIEYERTALRLNNVTIPSSQ